MDQYRLDPNLECALLFFVEKTEPINIAAAVGSLVSTNVPLFILMFWKNETVISIAVSCISAQYNAVEIREAIRVCRESFWPSVYVPPVDKSMLN